jgi:anti-sigma B factor antagonist
MRLHEYRENDIDVLELEGEIDLHYAPVLRDLLCGKARSRCHSLLLDVSRVEFIDSTGLAAIIDYLRKSNSFGGRFCIGGVGEQLQPIFEIIRLDRAMPIFAEVAKAKQALTYNCVPAVSEPLFKSAA